MPQSISNSSVQNPKLQKPIGLRFFLPLAIMIWLGVVGVGLAWMWEYETTPGELTKSPEYWPASSQINLDSNRATLVMFAHPRCPCTRATIRELAQIMTHCSGHVDAKVCFYKPTVFSGEWEKTDLWDSAEAIPGVTVMADIDGVEAKRFCATTSGYTLLYKKNGQLLFSGGITGSRGHEGDNIGRSAIETILIQGLPAKSKTLVFGCPLLEQDDVCEKEGQQCLSQ